MSANTLTPYPDSYYSRSLAESRIRQAATGSIEVEYLIIGGGLAGLTTAFELAKAGKAPLLLEAEAVAFGASGRNGGFVSPGFACGRNEIVRRIGDATADKLFKLSLDAVDYVRANCKSFGNDADINPVDGIMSVRRNPDADALKQEQEWLANRGYETEFLTRDQVQERAQSPYYHEALRSDRSFHIHPLNYARALARAAEEQGAAIHGNSVVRELTEIADGFIALTDTARVKARNVIVTTGGYTGSLIPKLRHAYVPVATYVMMSEQAPELISTAIRTRDGIGDNRRAGDYYRLIENGQRLLWGGAITIRDRNPKGVTEYLRRGMVETYPQLKNLKFEAAWSGWMSYARHKMPQIGQMGNGLWYATAFGGHGLNTTAMAGRLIAQALTNHSDDWKLFSPWGLSWTGGPVGKLAAQATYHWLQWQDRRQEAKYISQ